jgi:hypothetical protein
MQLTVLQVQMSVDGYEVIAQVSCVVTQDIVFEWPAAM